jgi:hypothetical protein
MAVRHLKEIAGMLQAAHGGRIPIVRPIRINLRIVELKKAPDEVIE